MYSLFYIYNWIATGIGNSLVWKAATKSILSCLISILLLILVLVLLAGQTPIASPWGYVVGLLWIGIMILLLALARTIGHKMFGN